MSQDKNRGEGSWNRITGRTKWILGGRGGGGAGGELAGQNLSTWQDEGKRKLASLIHLATLSSPVILPPSSPLCPLSSFTFTLHPAGVGLVASDGWRGSDAVYRIGLRGLAVSAVWKVASAVWYNMVCSLATKLLAAAVAHQFVEYEDLMSAACRSS